MFQDFDVGETRKTLKPHRSPSEYQEAIRDQERRFNWQGMNHWAKTKLRRDGNGMERWNQRLRRGG